MADFFIKRPILSICLSVIIVLLGAFSILRLPISEYPDIIPPSIQVTATYPGADCETVVKSIASPIEQQMSGVDGMSYMTSVNTNNGQMSMMILFEIGTEANMDQVLSYLRYGQATSQLPSAVSALGVSLRKTSGLPALVVSLYSPQGTYDGLWLANYAYINMVDAIKRVPGVGDVQVFGAGRYAMRIWLNPEKMAALNITARDVMLAVQAQNAVNPAGKIGAHVGNQFPGAGQSGVRGHADRGRAQKAQGAHFHGAGGEALFRLLKLYFCRAKIAGDLICFGDFSHVFSAVKRSFRHGNGADLRLGKRYHNARRQNEGGIDGKACRGKDACHRILHAADLAA